MSYRYEFDDTRDGDLRLRRTSYELLQDAYRGLCDELEAWNRRALEHGGSTPPLSVRTVFDGGVFRLFDGGSAAGC